MAGVTAISLPGIVRAGTISANISAIAGSVPSEMQPGDNDDSLTILFQGDSITDGGRSHNQDWNHLMGSGYVYILASSLWYRYPERKFQFINRGVSGNKITDLAARWQTDTIDVKPDVLSILVGVNDVNSVIDNSKDMVDSARYEKEYRALLHQAKEKLPGVELILCEPFILPLGHTKDRYPQWLDEIKKRQASVLKLSKEFDTMYVNFQDVFNEALERAPADYWIWDGIHPMPAGHQMMANHWTEIVHKKLAYIK
ncbi:MAG: SGNH/GDSL hydrolase family protein [Ginsengibacter sp.]